MMYTSEFIEALESMSGMPDLTENSIALALSIDVEQLRKPGILKEAYDRGRLAAKIEFNKKVMQLSNQGSGPAQTLLNKMYQNQQTQELREYYG